MCFFLHPACRPSVSVLVDGKNGFTTRKKIGTHHLPTSQRGVLCIVFFSPLPGQPLVCRVSLSVLAGSDRRLGSLRCIFIFSKNFDQSLSAAVLATESGEARNPTKKRITPFSRQSDPAITSNKQMHLLENLQRFFFVGLRGNGDEFDLE